VTPSRLNHRCVVPFSALYACRLGGRWRDGSRRQRRDACRKPARFASGGSPSENTRGRTRITRQTGRPRRRRSARMEQRSPIFPITAVTATWGSRRRMARGSASSRSSAMRLSASEWRCGRRPATSPTTLRSRPCSGQRASTHAIE
jgi:hypothetical protein